MTNCLNCGAPITGSVCEYCGIRYGTVFVPASPPPAMRGIHNKRTHAGKGGKVIFPSDYLTRKEREAMNGEIKTYALNRPMRWKEFKLLPDDVRREYIENLQKRFDVQQKDLAAMFGVSVQTVGLETKKLGIKFPHRGG